MSGIERFYQLLPLENVEPKQVDYFDLLDSTFLELKTELETNGNTKCFRQIQLEKGEEILAFWKGQAGIYRQAVLESKINDGDNLILEDNSKLLANILQDYDRDDEHILHISKEKRGEVHQISITVSEDTGLDEFLHPPKVESKFNKEDEELKEYIYEVIFRANKISTFTRAIIHTHKDYQLPWVKRIEIIDTSSFGVERPIETEIDQG